MTRQHEFEEQLHRDDLQTVKELMNNPEKEALKQFYEYHFNEITDLIANCKSIRTVIEDICNLEPNMSPLLMADSLFVYTVNVAIKNGVLTKNSFA